MDTSELIKQGLQEVQPKLIGPENYSIWKNNLFMDLHYTYPFVWQIVSEGDDKVRKEKPNFDDLKKQADEILSQRIKTGIDKSLEGKELFNKLITTDNFKELDEIFDDPSPTNRAKTLIHWFSARTGVTRKEPSNAQDMALKWILLVDDYEELLLNVYFHYEIPFEEFVKMLEDGLKLHAQQKDASYIAQEATIKFEETHKLAKRTTPIKAARWVGCTTPFGNYGDPEPKFMSHSRMHFDENHVDELGDYEQKMPYTLKFNDEGL